MKILRLTVILIFMLGFLSLCAQDAQNMQQSLMYRRGGGGIKATSIVSVTLGLVAGGVALYYHNEANKAYDEYKTAIDTQIAVDWYDKASQNDTMALISAGVGGGLIAFGVIHAIVSRGHSYSYRNHDIHISTESRQHYSGINVCIDLQPSR